MYTYDNFHIVKEEIEASRLRARSEAEARSASLGLVSPEIAAIDEELRGTGMAVFKIACEGGAKRSLYYNDIISCNLTLQGRKS